VKKLKGKFIVFDGLPGSGKGTMIKKTFEYLYDKSKEYDSILITDEPTRGPHGKRVRELFKKQTSPNDLKEEIFQAFVDDRDWHIKEIISPALAKDMVVICDRYKYSSIVYQTVQGNEFEKVFDAHKDFLSPDLAIILDLPPQVGVERMNKDKFSSFFKYYADADSLGNEDKIKFNNTRNLLYVSCSRAIKNLRILYLDDVSEFKNGIAKWVTLDNEQSKLNSRISEIRKEKKGVENFVVNFMEANQMTNKNILINGGKLKYDVSNSKESITKKYILEKLTAYFKDEKKAEEITNYIYDARAVTTEKVSLKRTNK